VLPINEFGVPVVLREGKEEDLVPLFAAASLRETIKRLFSLIL
jgi:hypothetical protein